MREDLGKGVGKVRRSDYRKLILPILLKDGKLTLKELEERVFTYTYHFHAFGYTFHNKLLGKLSKPILRLKHRAKSDSLKWAERWRERTEEKVDVKMECKRLIEDGLIRMGEDGEYELTENGKVEAEKVAKEMAKKVTLLEKHVLSPIAAVRNTVIINACLAMMKLLTGLLSGSAGLIADGADATVDTVSAFIVWVGEKVRREALGTLVIISMMFITAITIGYESITRIVNITTTSVSPISAPYLVILVEGAALLIACLLYFYQRYVGARNGSLVLLAQSIDSKNHIYIAIAVIVGAALSIYNINFIDALVGAFISIKIFKDGIELSRELVTLIRGEAVDLSRYKIPFEKHWKLSKLETFRIWILYSVEDGLNTKEALIQSLETAFKRRYFPTLSESRYSLGEGFNFEEEFNDLIRPLLEDKLIAEEDGKFILTERGKRRINGIFRSLRYRGAK